MIDDEKKRKGWIRLHRSLCDSDLWFLEPFTKAQAWVDLILNANHKSAKISIRGNILTIQRGQLGWSEITMSKRWKWSRDKVRGFLAFLQNDEKIIQQKTHITTIISICNYDIYQDMTATDPTTDPTTEKQQTLQQKNNRPYTNKNDKNIKNEKKVRAMPIPVLSEFVSFCSELGIATNESEGLFYRWESQAWESKGQPIKNWKSKVQQFLKQGYIPKAQTQEDIFAGMKVCN